jgi:ATPase subunit of ABC transporter with duplicated ATPase domains
MSKPNGAGKSTTMRLIMGLDAPSGSRGDGGIAAAGTVLAGTFTEAGIAAALGVLLSGEPGARRAQGTRRDTYRDQAPPRSAWPGGAAPGAGAGM